MIEILEPIVKEAGKLFKEGYYKTKAVSFKGSVDLVTEYDVAVEQLLEELLSAEFSEYTIIGEEHSSADERAEKAIYVDPIDGTTNFVHGIPMCAISVGVWERGVPVAGIVYNPILDECFSAEKGKGAYLNGERLHVSGETQLERSLIATGFPYTKTERGADYRWVLDSMASLMPLTRDIRRLGSASIDLCYVAKGVFEGFYECNLKPWDVAAGIVILQEAGGMVSNERNETYTLDDHIIVATNTAIHAKLCDATAPYGLNP